LRTDQTLPKAKDRNALRDREAPAGRAAVLADPEVLEVEAVVLEAEAAAQVVAAEAQGVSAVAVLVKAGVADATAVAVTMTAVVNSSSVSSAAHVV
jgi:hypothetical protein